ncbi:unnamed protein product, partial [Meganyctiphanes norvegica]
PFSKRRAANLNEYDRAILKPRVQYCDCQIWRHKFHDNPVNKMTPNVSCVTADSFYEDLFSNEKFNVTCSRPSCRNVAKYSFVGFGPSRFAVVSCTACGNSISGKSKKLTNRLFVRQLKCAYVALVRDNGWEGYLDWMNALNISNPVNQTTFFNHFKKVYSIQNKLWDKLKKKKLMLI